MTHELIAGATGRFRHEVFGQIDTGIADAVAADADQVWMGMRIPSVKPMVVIDALNLFGSNRGTIATENDS